MSVPGQIIDSFLADPDRDKILDKWAFTTLTNKTISRDESEHLVQALFALLAYHKIQWLKANNVRTLEFKQPEPMESA